MNGVVSAMLSRRGCCQERRFHRTARLKAPALWAFSSGLSMRCNLRSPTPLWSSPAFHSQCVCLSSRRNCIAAVPISCESTFIMMKRQRADDEYLTFPRRRACDLSGRYKWGGHTCCVSGPALGKRWVPTPTKRLARECKCRTASSRCRTACCCCRWGT